VCSARGRGYLHIWYLYVQAALQLLQVLNASQNLPIYWFVGSQFKNTAKKYLRWSKESGRESHSPDTEEGKQTENIVVDEKC